MPSSSWNGRPAFALLAGKEEDRFTEFLVQLLQAPEVLRAFLGNVCGMRVPDSELSSLTVRTQVTVPGGRPDIAIRGPNRYCLIEAKVGSWLHDAQVLPYVQELRRWRSETPAGETNLFLLAPSRSSRGLLQTARQQMSGAGAAEMDVRAIDWEMVGEVLGRESELVGNPRLRVYLQDFADLIARRMGLAVRPFTPEEAHLLGDPLAARALLGARRLVDQIVSILRENHAGEVAVGHPTYGSGYDGYSIRTGTRWWWLGFWLDAWATAGESAICLQIPGFREQDRSKLPTGFAQPQEYKNSKRTGWVVPLPIRGQVELQELAAEHASAVLAWIKEFPESGGLNSPSGSDIP